MSFLPPWIGLFFVLVLLGGLAAWVLQRGLKQQGASLGLAWSPGSQAQADDAQSQANRRIQGQNLADLEQALADGRLDARQHAVARDELMRQVLGDEALARTPSVALTDGSSLRPQPAAAVGWGWVVVALVVLSGLSYLQLGAPQTWWPLPLSQRVQISATTPEQLTEQTRVWQQATQNRPEDAAAWLTLARLHAAQNAHAPAEQALARVLALSPEPDLWIERAQMKALSAGGVYTGEPWQWIENMLKAQPQHLNALVLAGSAALSEKRHAAAQTYWQQALALVPAESEAAQGLQQAVAQAAAMAQPAAVENPVGQTVDDARRASPLVSVPVSTPASSSENTIENARATNKPRTLIQGEVRVSAQVQSQIGPGATLLVYALAEEGTRRPVAIWRGTPNAWPVAFALSDSMGMGAPPLLSELKQVRLVARISKTGAAQRQPDDFQVELPGVKTGVQGVVLDITGKTPSDFQVRR